MRLDRIGIAGAFGHGGKVLRWRRALRAGGKTGQSSDGEAVGGYDLVGARGFARRRIPRGDERVAGGGPVGLHVARRAAHLEPEGVAIQTHRVVRLGVGGCEFAGIDDLDFAHRVSVG